MTVDIENFNKMIISGTYIFSTIKKINEAGRIYIPKYIREVTGISEKGEINIVSITTDEGEKVILLVPIREV